MTDFLSAMRLTSGLPFGLLIQLVGLSLSGVASIIGATRAKGPARTLCGLVALLIAARLVLGVGSDLLLREDLNPIVCTPDLVGSWRDGSRHLMLRNDGTFQSTGFDPENGRWSLEDNQLQLGALSARVIEVNDEHRIVLAFPLDPDEWDGRLGFARD